MQEIKNIIQELRCLIDEENTDLLANESDAAYFRSIWKQKAIEKPPLQKEVLLEEPTNFEPPIIPAPKVVLKPIEPVVEKVAEKLVVETLPPLLSASPPLRSNAQLLSSESSFDFKAMKTLFQKTCPEIAIIDEIPIDTLAKRIGSRWKARKMGGRVILFYYQELEPHKVFLEKVVHAIDIYFGPARLLSAEEIEQKGEWETLFSLPELELVIASDSTLWQLPKLRSFYKELPREQKRMLGEKPLFLLPDLSLYFKDPLLKRSLWRALCQMLSS